MDITDVAFRVRRKALSAIPTRCRECKTVWIDKVFHNPHKVVCPKCFHVNAVLERKDVETLERDLTKMMALKEVGMLDVLGVRMKKPNLLKALHALMELKLSDE